MTERADVWSLRIKLLCSD